MGTKTPGAMLGGLLLLGLAACGGLLHPKILVATDLEGKTLQLGSTVGLQWECVECDHVPATAVLVTLIAQDEKYYSSQPVAFGPISGSATWHISTDVNGQPIEPGRYVLTFNTYPEDQGYNDRNEQIDAFAISGTFDIAP